MVEAAGIEPASENRDSRTSTCVVPGSVLAFAPARQPPAQPPVSLRFRVGAGDAPLGYPARSSLQSPKSGRSEVKRAALFVRQPLHTNNRLQLHLFPAFLRGQAGATARSSSFANPRRNHVAPTPVYNIVRISGRVKAIALTCHPFCHHVRVCENRKGSRELTSLMVLTTLLTAEETVGIKKTRGGQENRVRRYFMCNNSHGSDVSQVTNK
jgi:hypothetical protein